MKNKKFLLFGNKKGYSNGGFNDLMASSDDCRELIYSVTLKDMGYAQLDDNTARSMWWHIVDTDKQKIIAGSRWQPAEIYTLDENSPNIRVYGYIESLPGYWAWMEYAKTN